MDIHFSDPTEIPLPLDEVRINELKTEILSGGKRLRIFMRISPFQRSPDVNIVVKETDSDTILAETSIIGSSSQSMEFIMHLRDQPKSELLSLIAMLYYYPEITRPDLNLCTIPEYSPVVIDKQEITIRIREKIYPKEGNHCIAKAD